MCDVAEMHSLRNTSVIRQSWITNRGHYPGKCYAQELMNAADWKQAEQEGRVTPKPGVDEEYDRAVQQQNDAEQALQV